MKCRVWRHMKTNYLDLKITCKGSAVWARNNTVNTLRPRQNGRCFADDSFKRIFLNKNARISIEISLKFAPKGPINYIPALAQIMAWRRSGDKPLSEPMMVSLLTHICVTRPLWVQFIQITHSRHLAVSHDTLIMSAWERQPNCTLII